MKTITSFFFSFVVFVLLSSSNYAQVSADTTPIENRFDSYKPSINVFTIDGSNKDFPFISLSEIQNTGAAPDSIVIPHKDKNGLEVKRYKLNSAQRRVFLSQTGVSENDFVFIYDYRHNDLFSFPVKNLRVVARLSHYSQIDYPDYMIGFEVDEKALRGFKGNIWDALVCVERKNPFAQKQLTPLVWHKITPEEDEAALSKGFEYLMKTDEFHYFLGRGSSQRHSDVMHLLVVEPQTQEVVMDKVFYSSEGGSLYPLRVEGDNHTNNESFAQWTGKLFKDKPPVVFGFESLSFGCPSISVIDRTQEEIFLYCDNRH